MLRYVACSFHHPCLPCVPILWAKSRMPFCMLRRAAKNTTGQGEGDSNLKSFLFLGIARVPLFDSHNSSVVLESPHPGRTPTRFSVKIINGVVVGARHTLSGRWHRCLSESSPHAMPHFYRGAMHLIYPGFQLRALVPLSTTCCLVLPIGRTSRPLCVFLSLSLSLFFLDMTTFASNLRYTLYVMRYALCIVPRWRSCQMASDKSRDAWK
ncbi:hypothetical protein V8C34DRAFT_213127 [Trichoderma compactum]